MKRYLDLVMYVLYTYYKKGNKDTPFLSAKSSLGLCFLLNILTALTPFHLIQNIEVLNQKPSPIQYICVFIIVAIPLYIIMGLLFKEEEIQKLEYSELTKNKASVFVVCYMISSFIILAVFAVVFK